MRNTALVILATLCLTGCIGFGGGSGILGSTNFALHFRDGGGFPKLDAFDNVLLVDVSDQVDWLAEHPTLEERIDGTLVHTQVVTQGGTLELPFVPTEWTPTAGEHEVEITIGDVTHSLPFTWND